MRDDPERLAVELSKVGTTPGELALDVRDVPELRERYELLTPEARLLLALEWFGDQGHSQPTERTEWHILGYTPDWGRLPRLDDAEQAAASERPSSSSHTRGGHVP